MFFVSNFEKFFVMSKRVTIVLNEDLLKKLRIIQSKKIAKSTEHFSFSRVINDELRKAIKEVK